MVGSNDDCVGGARSMLATHKEGGNALVASRGSATSGGRATAPAISLVIPAYNEEKRLPVFLETVWAYMPEVFGNSYEVIVVDDGSSDATARVVADLSHTWPRLRIERHERNQGKGSAVRTGVRSSRGEIVLFSDADGACPITEEAKLRRELIEEMDIVVGSRRVGESERSRRWHRAAMGSCFAVLTRRMTGLTQQDTQCGFKMFRGPVARELFAMCPRDDYLFDLFILMTARARGFQIAEVGVSWCEVPGSQLRLLRDSWKMIGGLFTIRSQVKRELRKSQKHSIEPVQESASLS